jgi:HEAT repeat protein
MMSMNPEALPVRRFAAIALGRMEAEAALPTLRDFQSGQAGSEIIKQATTWAIEHITGERSALDPLPARRSSGWFLEPVDADEANAS